MELFARLLDFIFPLRAHERVVRDISPETLARLLSPRLIETLLPPATALFPYRHAVIRSLITEAKFNENAKAFSLLATPLHDYLESVIEDTNAFTLTEFVIIPIPLSPSRRKERGYNQTLKLMERATPAGALLLPGLLERVRDTAPQTSLGREERLLNMKGAFRATAPLAPATTYIVFDDVITTGATLSSAVGALRTAGAINIIPLALAY